MNKTTIRSLTIGSIALTAATAGAWFVLTSEPAKNEMSSPVSSSSPPTSVPVTKRQESNMVLVPDQNPIPSALPTAPSATATDPLDIRLGDIQERDNEKGQEEPPEAGGTVPAEVVEKTETNNSEQTASDNKPTSVAQTETNDSTPPDLPADQESASDRPEELPDHATITSSFPTGEEKQVQDVVPPPNSRRKKRSLARVARRSPRF
ncbi:MAG: hypothetical protein WGN25_07155 [Candidatus Electrothrix sp. GW3-4]|uniref:hypothetical protein n=1 Tax=Candidatus Electrothrix sp. GW3-4 TaxID=3126740 RepID=UPI0030CEEF24